MHYKSMLSFTYLVLLSLLAAPASAAHAIQRQVPGVESVGGSEPDGFGYTYDDTVAYNWIPGTINSGLSGGGRFTGPVEIGFPFPFYGMPQTHLYLNTSGIITFDAGSEESRSRLIPHPVKPNHFIAAFWTNMLVGSPFNDGAIYYARGGSAPNRYFVVEWREVETSIYNVGTFSFEAVLYENGDILVQHQSLPTYYETPRVGLEDAFGEVGLPYETGTGGLSAPNAILFHYPTDPAAGLRVRTRQTGAFTQPGAEQNFPVTVSNPGRMGADTYDFVPAFEAWTVDYYAADGLTPLTETDGDLLPDTGPIPAGESAEVMVRIHTPADAQSGSAYTENLHFVSSLDPAVEKSISLSVSVPAGFVSVFEDAVDGAMSFLSASAAGTSLSKATMDHYTGSNMVVARLMDGNYFYAWHKGRWIGISVEEIEYALLDRQGNVLLPPGKLTDHSGASLLTHDTEPSVAVAPDGTVGVVWTRHLYNTATRGFNYNIYFAGLSPAGVLQTGPISLTNNTVWRDGNYLVFPEFSMPTIAASSDNRFVIGWVTSHLSSGMHLEDNIWYAVRDTAGTSTLPPTQLTSNTSWKPVLNSLSGGKVIITWRALYGGPYYAVIHSRGAVVKPATPACSDSTSQWYDAVQLSDRKIALACATRSGVELFILNAAYSLESGPHAAANPTSSIPVPSTGLSVTTDASSHVIMTWVEELNYNQQLYALADSTGTFITRPMAYRESTDLIDVSWNGQGNAPHSYQGGSLVDVAIGGTLLDRHLLLASESQRVSHSGVNNGPVRIENRDAIPALASERVIYKVNGANTSFTEMMGLPNSQLDNTYWLPWYNNVDLDTQLRFANVSGSPATVHVYIGGEEMTGSPFTLLAGESTRKSFVGVNAGPVQIVSDENIVAAERLIYKVNNVATSFSETMAVPNSQLDTRYWLPWYNNAELDTQLRFANVSTSAATVHVYIGGDEMPGSPFTLAAGESTRKSFAAVNAGPVEIVSDHGVPIVAAERLIYKVNNIATSFTEMMALPNSQLNTTYWLPWYNNKELDTQLRFANVTDQTAAVHVYIGGDEMPGSPFTLAAGESTRKSFANINNGPVQIVSDQNIVAAERLIYKANNIATSFSEMMALPNSQLNTTYWLPWYNNVELDTQLRFGVP